MFYIKMTYSSRLFRVAIIIAASLAISVGVKSNTPAQENRFYGDHRSYESRDRFYNNYNRNGREFRDENNLPPRWLKDGYFVQHIKDNPTAYGAKIRYLNDNWDNKYMYWVPEGFNSQNLRPLVISLHGNDEEVQDAFARWYHTVKQYNYVFAAPKWKSSNGVMKPAEISAFIEGIIKELKEKENINVDPAMVILHGYERGANIVGYLDYFNPGRYRLTIVDSGPFPSIGSAFDAETSPSGQILTIPADEMKNLMGSYIYLYSRYEDQSIYQKLEESRQILVEAGANAELNYTKGMFAGDFSEVLSNSIVDMFDRSIGKK